MARTIETIRLVRESDDCGYDMLSDLGHESDRRETVVDVDLYARGESRRDHRRYFVPMNPDPDYPEHAVEDCDRYLKYGWDWWYDSIYAEATILVQDGPCAARQTVRSGGLHWVESDCGDEDRAEVFEGERADLDTMLRGLGFSDEEIAAAPVEADS